MLHASSNVTSEYKLIITNSFDYTLWQSGLPHTDFARAKFETELEEHLWFRAACMATIRFRRANQEHQAAEYV